MGDLTRDHGHDGAAQHHSGGEIDHLAKTYGDLTKDRAIDLSTRTSSWKQMVFEQAAFAGLVSCLGTAHELIDFAANLSSLVESKW